MFAQCSVLYSIVELAAKIGVSATGDETARQSVVRRDNKSAATSSNGVKGSGAYV